MAIECLILDFDGTFTDVEKEAEGFFAGFRSDLMADGVTAEEWDGAISEIMSDPDQYGWEYNGVIVAPSHADPYILATSAGQKILRKRGLSSSADREAKLSDLYKRNYEKATTVFRPEARAAIETLISSTLPIFVVTNSNTAHVQKKLLSLEARGLEHLRVVGDARKFVIGDPDTPSDYFTGLPETSRIAGLNRDIYMKRGKYVDALRRIWNETGASPESTLVCGDIYELDLAVPAALGTAIHLVTRKSTADYEKAVVRNHPTGQVSSSLTGLLSRLELPG